MLTCFGELLRQIHKENGCVMYDTAEATGLTSSHVSDIMHGKTFIPAGFIDRLTARYSISDEMMHALYQAARGEVRG